MVSEFEPRLFYFDDYITMNNTNDTKHNYERILLIQLKETEQRQKQVLNKICHIF